MFTCPIENCPEKFKTLSSQKKHLGSRKHVPEEDLLFCDLCLEVEGVEPSKYTRAILVQHKSRIHKVGRDVGKGSKAKKVNF